MRNIHRIIRSLAFGPALAGISIVSPAVLLAQGGPATISLMPSKVMVGATVTIDIKFKGQCSSGRLSFGDGTGDRPLSGGPTFLGTPVQHAYGLAGTYKIKTYFSPGSTAMTADQTAKYTANCKGGPVTLQVTASGAAGSAGATPPTPSAPGTANTTGTTPCNDGTIANTTSRGACANHGGAKPPSGSPNAPPAPPAPPGANANNTPAPQTCNDGTVINNQGAHVCDNHGGFKSNSPPATGTGATCNDGTVSNSQGKGACKDHHGVLQPIPQLCNDGTMSNNTADNACASHGGFKKANGTPNTPAAPPPAPNTNAAGATCNDGTISNATGKGACAHHGGIKKDSTVNAPPAPPSP